MIILAFILFFAKALVSDAYPLEPRGPTHNSTDPAQSTSGWVSAPNVRGTADLLFSSLTTLALCAWTAYHPNVHPHRGVLHTPLRRVKWMVAAILIPEWVLWCAWNQRYTALALKETINKILKKEDKPDEKAETPKMADSQATALGPGPGESMEKKPARMKHALWTTEQAFFAVCGGFSVDSSTFWPHGQLTFTPNGLIELAKLGLLPKVSPTTVEDKSKADVIAKALVCLQAGWFLVQTIARLIQHLPVTLLEVHVVAHIACAFGMYLLWLEKPYDAGYPIIFEDERVKDVAALFAADAEGDKRHRYRPHAEDVDRNEVDIRDIRSAHVYASKRLSKRARLRLSFYRFQDSTTGPRHRLTKFSDDQWFKGTFPQSSTPVAENHIKEHLLRANRGVQVVWKPSTTDEVQQSQLSNLSIRIPTSTEPVPQPSHPPPLPPASPSPSPEPRSPTSPPTPSALSTSPINNPSPSHSQHPSPPPSPPPSPTLSTSTTARTLDRIHSPTPPRPTDRPFYASPHIVSASRNHTTKGRTALFTHSNHPLSRPLPTLALVLLGLAYGAVHLAAWDAHFPTPAEKWMWRASGLAFAGLPGSLAWLVWGAEGRRTVWPRREEERAGLGWVGLRRVVGTVWGGVDVVVFVVLMPVSVAYVVGRGFVVVEAFAGLRGVQEGTYRTVEWTGFMPHVG